jgi:cellulose synthase/poly-beta-1,6-N-acetylglucosamine synthase-like glycosyltransferase
MISVIITAFKEPNLSRCLDSWINQNFKGKYEIIIVAPDEESKNLVNNYSKKYKNIKYFNDPGRGKVFALNLLFKVLYNNNLNHILILSDGDLIVDNDVINIIFNIFKDKTVGCVSGRPVALNDRNKMVGYWSHLLLDAGAHKIRKELSDKNQFLECSGYLFAFRNGLIKELPLDVAEDSITPYYIWKKGYKIKYAEYAKVYVKYPDTIKEFVRQRKRAGAGSHSKLRKYAKDHPKVKSFYNEIKKGTLWALSYPKNFKEFIWTILLFFVRLYIWFIYYWEAIIYKKSYQDAWERVEATKSF